MKLRFLPSVSLKEVQPTHPAEIFLHHTSVLPAKPMEEIERKNKEIEQTRMQSKMQIPQELWKPQTGIYILELEPECMYIWSTDHIQHIRN